MAAQNITAPKMQETGTIHWLCGEGQYEIMIKNFQDVRKTFSQLHTKEILPRQNDNGFNVADNWYSISTYTAQPVNIPDSRIFAVVVFCAAVTYELGCALIL